MILFICARRMEKIMVLINTFQLELWPVEVRNDPLPDSVGRAGKGKILQISDRKHLIAFKSCLKCDRYAVCVVESDGHMHAV